MTRKTAIKDADETAIGLSAAELEAEYIVELPPRELLSVVSTPTNDPTFSSGSFAAMQGQNGQHVWR